MSDARFAFDVAYQLVIGALYGAVAYAAGRRSVGAHAEKAHQAFITWWATLALVSVARVAALVVGRLGGWTFAAYTTYTQMVLLAIVLALMALMYYFVFLFTGKPWATNAVVVFYIGFAAFIFHWFNLSDPVGLTEGPGGGVQLEYANDLADAAITQWLGILLLLPLVLGALAYSTLYFRVDDRTQRFRIVTVGGSIFLWLLTSLGASLGGVDANEQSWWLYTSRAIAIFATLANYMAFKPPAWLQRRLGMRPVDEPSDADASS